MKTWGMILFTFVILASMTIAAEEPSVGKGQELFNGTKLGTNGKGCASCHRGGSGLRNAADYDEARLAQIVNQCIAKALKGEPLATDSTEMKSLLMYVKTFSRPGP